MKKEELIGKKVRGFRFAKEAFSKVEYMSAKMDKYVGKEGVIEEYNIQFDSFRVKFEDGMSYHYPAERIEHHLIVEEPTIEEFTPIAMKCSQEQFDDIKPLLESGGCDIVTIAGFMEYCYLVNNFNEVQNDIGNVCEDMIRKVYHEWDKNIFLNACGIECKEPTKEINYNNVSVRICEDNSLIGYYTDDCGITSFGKTFDELLRNLQHAKKAIEEAREKLAKEDLERFEKSLNQSAEEFINDANRNIIENDIVEEVINNFEKAQKDLIKPGYTCPQTKQQCDDECCVSAENCHLKTSVDLEEAKIKANKGVDISFDCKSSNDLKSESLNKKQEPINLLDDLPIIGDGVLMEVSTNGINWHERYTFAKYNNSFVAWADHESTISIQLWKHARPITPKTKITRKEFESKFEIID